MIKRLDLISKIKHINRVANHDNKVPNSLNDILNHNSNKYNS